MRNGSVHPGAKPDNLKPAKKKKVVKKKLGSTITTNNIKKYAKKRNNLGSDSLFMPNK